MRKVIIGIIAITFIVVGCKGKPQRRTVLPQKKAVQPVKEVKVEREPPEELKITYRYEPFGKPDPFEPIFSMKKTGETPLVKSPLEEYNVEQFELVGVIWGMKHPVAIVRAPNGRTYIIKKGTRMGRNNGRVTRITEGKIYVVEEYEDIYGHITTGEVVLELKTEE